MSNRIENWALVYTPGASPYTPPELIKVHLRGDIYGSEKHEDGKMVVTSPIIGINERNEIKTQSGSTYELGKVSADFEEVFPDAHNRTIQNLKNQQTQKRT